MPVSASPGTPTTANAVVAPKLPGPQTLDHLKKLVRQRDSVPADFDLSALDPDTVKKLKSYVAGSDRLAKHRGNLPAHESWKQTLGMRFIDETGS